MMAHMQCTYCCTKIFVISDHNLYFPCIYIVILGRCPALLRNYPEFLLKSCFLYILKITLVILASALCLLLDAINLTPKLKDDYLPLKSVIWHRH